MKWDDAAFYIKSRFSFKSVRWKTQFLALAYWTFSVFNCTLEVLLYNYCSIMTFNRSLFTLFFTCQLFQSYCRSIGGYLARIESKEENDYIKGVAVSRRSKYFNIFKLKRENVCVGGVFWEREWVLEREICHQVCIYIDL